MPRYAILKASFYPYTACYVCQNLQIENVPESLIPKCLDYLIPTYQEFVSIILKSLGFSALIKGKWMILLLCIIQCMGYAYKQSRLPVCMVCSPQTAEADKKTSCVNGQLWWHIADEAHMLPA